MLSSSTFGIFCVEYHVTWKQWQFNFQFRFLLLLSIWFLSLGLLKLYQIKVAWLDILVLFLILKGMFHFLTVESAVNCALMYMVFMLRYVSSIPTFRFYHKWLLTLSKAFSISTEMVIWLWFDLLLWCITRTVDTEPSFIPRIKLTWSWCVVFLMNSWISLLVYWGVYIYVHHCYGPSVICLVLAAGWCWPQNWVQKCSFLCSFCGMVSVGSVLTLL